MNGNNTSGTNTAIQFNTSEIYCHLIIGTPTVTYLVIITTPLMNLQRMMPMW